MNLAQIDFAAASRSKCSSLHAGHEDHGAGVHLGAAPAHAAGGGGGDHGERGDELGREVRRSRGPARAVRRPRSWWWCRRARSCRSSRWRPASASIRRTPDEHGRRPGRASPRAAGVDAPCRPCVSAGGSSAAMRAVLDQQRAHGRLRLREIAGEELADVLDQEAGHAILVGGSGNTQRRQGARSSQARGARGG